MMATTPTAAMDAPPMVAEEPRHDDERLCEALERIRNLEERLAAAGDAVDTLVLEDDAERRACIGAGFHAGWIQRRPAPTDEPPAKRPHPATVDAGADVPLSPLPAEEAAGAIVDAD